MGSTDDCCTSTNGVHVFQGWWKVPFSEEIQHSVNISGCSHTSPGPCSSAWTLGLGPAEKSEETWKIKLRATSPLGVANESCPLAWELGSRNVWWILTAISLALAVCLCWAVASAGGGGDKAMIPICMCIGLCVLLAVIFFMFALLSDFWYKDGAK